MYVNVKTFKLLLGEELEYDPIQVYNILLMLKKSKEKKELQMLEIVEYPHQEHYYFRNIPQDDNPAYGDKECLMIVPQEPLKPPYYHCGRWDVLHIKPNNDPAEQESVWQLGKFWEIEHARLFANEFAKQAQNSL